MQGHQLVSSLSPSHTHNCTVLPLAHPIVCLPALASLSTSLSPSFLELAIMADHCGAPNRERRFVLVCTEPPLQVIDPMDPDNFKPPRATIWMIQPAPSISLALLAIREAEERLMRQSSTKAAQRGPAYNTRSKVARRDRRRSTSGSDVNA